MWILISVRAETNDDAERKAIYDELNQGLLHRPWVTLFPNCVALDMFGPADINHVGGVLDAIAAGHPDRFFYAAIAEPEAAFPHMRPKLPFNEALFRLIVGPRPMQTPNAGDAAFGDGAAGVGYAPAPLPQAVAKRSRGRKRNA